MHPSKKRWGRAVSFDNRIRYLVSTRGLIGNSVYTVTQPVGLGSENMARALDIAAGAIAVRRYWGAFNLLYHSELYEVLKCAIGEDQFVELMDSILFLADSKGTFPRDPMRSLWLVCSSHRKSQLPNRIEKILREVRLKVSAGQLTN